MTPITGRPHRLADKPPTLELDDVTVELTGALGSGRALSEVSLEVWPGEIVGLIGESGSGKTMAALSILGLAPSAARLTAGEIRLSGSPLTGLSAAELRAIRGNRLAMIPQDAMTAMNPVLRVNTQVGEPYVLHRKFPWRAAKERAVSLLKTVHMPSAEQRARDYPHQLSGGMLQRAMIAMGLALEPELLIADEPTTALDVTIQAQILRLLRDVRDEHGTAILFITHDLGVVAELCDWVYVMYAGRIVEQASVEQIFARPAHPYTQALLRSTPTIESSRQELVSIPGRIPSPYDWTAACRFADRCEARFERCAAEPTLLLVEPEHTARCWLVDRSP